MTTPKTWEEVREIAAKAAWEQLSAGRTWESASVLEREERRIEADASLRALRAAGLAIMPREATEAMWGGLARDIVFAERAHNGNCTGAELHQFLQNIGRPPPQWLSKMIPPVKHVPAKGDVAAAIYTAALSAGELAPPDKGEG